VTFFGSLEGRDS